MNPASTTPGRVAAAGLTIAALRMALAALAAAALLLPQPGAIPGATVASQTGYELVTRATYAVQPDDARIAVTVEATFTNRTPNPRGGLSVFEEVPFAVHDAAAKLEARDDDGGLDVSLRRADAGGGEANVATVRLRSPVRYGRSATFRLTYTLPDGGEPGLRVRRSAVRFVAWGFGTRSDVAIRLPAGYEARSDGDPLTAARTADGTELRSGAIDSPVEWAAFVVAAQLDPRYATLEESLPLAGATVEVRVEAWEDDDEWGARMLDLTGRALPLLEERFGPYPDAGPLVITEAAPTRSVGFAEDESGAGGEVRVAFDQPDFTLLHQLAHRWVTRELASERWIREGLASHAAGAIAATLEVEPPYDPAERAEALADVAFPLSAWPADASPDEEAYGYAASWRLVDQLAAEIGPETVAAALGRAAAGVAAYDPAATDAVASRAAPTEPAALDSRLFLDHLETLTGRDLTALYAPAVFGDEHEDLLAARARARTAYSDLLSAAGDWGAPRGVRRALEAWRFDDAELAIEEAVSWLEQRDQLLRTIDAAGLATPERLRSAWEQDGGGAAARAELEAARAVADSYAGVLDRTSTPPSLVARVGMLGVDPSEPLRRANALFAESDLPGAVDAIAQALRMVDGAETAGWVRIFSALTVLLVAAALAVAVMRRRRYTRGP